MTDDNIAHLILEQFRAMRNQIETLRSEVHDGFRDVNHRLHRLETTVAGIRREEAGTAEDLAYQHARLDQFGERLLRIERRLDLVN